MGDWISNHKGVPLFLILRNSGCCLEKSVVADLFFEHEEVRQCKKTHLKAWLFRLEQTNCKERRKNGTVKFFWNREEN